ncbi:MAG: carboxylating nicotinate-nucleotide diphosphorylase [Planctomycetota bacterium]|jgi:nicotinate-nucleotide pyrophosphorylase (carboxylating)|nr:carboxylating nicotinate-nucleotide diphosphorylase [Planctomycetota bacterium]
MPLTSSVFDLLSAALVEDLADRGDITTELALEGRGPPAHARVLARQVGRLSGLELAREIFAQVDPTVVCVFHKADGDSVQPEEVVLEASGPAASLLEAERTVLNFLGRLSGVATLTGRFVDRVAGTPVRILDTRKTTPGWRTLEKAAVLHGGGTNHRIGLFDEVLLKENHFALSRAPGYRELVAQVRAQAPDGVRITAEARDLEEAREVADGGADAILLDNFDQQALAEAVVALAGHPRRAAFELEASGCVTLENVAAVASAGVDRISVGALTHSAPALDLSMLLEADRS